MTVAEQVLWGVLRDRGVGLKCRRQALLAGWIPDFVIPSARLVIELDGGIHDLQQSHDEARTRTLEALGYRVVRFRNEEVLARPLDVLAAIERAAGQGGA
jgi:leucyl-tRNA synthetase